MASQLTELVSMVKDNNAAILGMQKDLSEMRHEMRIHNAEQMPLEALVRKHEIQLNGDEKAPGLVAAVGGLTKSMSNIERAVWVIIGVILTYAASSWLGVPIP